MIQNSTSFILATSLLIALFMLSGCSDDSPTGVDEGEPPTIPEASPVEVDNSLFENNNPTGEEYQTFNEAGALASGADANLMGATSMGQSFLAFTAGQNAEFEDGLWVWTFSFTDEGESISLRTTAEELARGVEWNVYISGPFDGEESLSEFRYLSGYVSDDGLSGNWQYFFPEEPDQPSVEYQWDTVSETEFTFSSIINLPEQDGELRIDYSRDNDDNNLEYSGYDFNQDAVIYWNSATGEGFLDREGQDRQCWDSNYAETECS